MTTADDIYRALEARQDARNEFNRWLGASLVGHHCRRYVAYSFRCAFRNSFRGLTLRVFEVGTRAEDRIVADLEATGKIKVSDRQRMIDLPSGLGHVGVTLDGVVFEDGVYRVLEMKTASAKSWRETAAKGVLASKPQHYAQMQFGMLLTGLQGALYVVENKDTQELYLEYVPYNHAAAEQLAAVAKSVLAGNEQVRCSERPDWYECAMCGAKGVCKGGEFPRVHCLTCCHSTAVEGGKWTCARWCGEVIPEATLPAGCAEHVWLPWLVPLPVEGWGEYYVTYRLPGGGRLCDCAAESFPAIDGGAAPVILSSAAIAAYGTVAALEAKAGDNAALTGGEAVPSKGVVGLFPVGLIPISPMIIQEANRRAMERGVLTFGHGIALVLALCATWGLCAVAIWIKRAIVRRIHKANSRRGCHEDRPD